MQKLNYFKCLVCLSPMSTYDRDLKECFCGGTVEFMGYVQRDPKVLLEDALHTPCNTLCTDAAGPCCSCSCGGKHHGTGKMVEVVRVVGQAPRAAKIDQKALDRAAEYLAHVDHAESALAAKFGAALVAVQSGQWIADRNTYRSIMLAFRSLNAIKLGKVHKRRITALKEFAAQLAA